MSWVYWCLGSALVSVIAVLYFGDDAKDSQLNRNEEHDHHSWDPEEIGW